MVKELKQAGKTTNEIVHKLSVIAAIASGTAAAAKLASEPKVQTGFGTLPVWQAVTAVLLVLVAGYIWNLETKNRG